MGLDRTPRCEYYRSALLGMASGTLGWEPDGGFAGRPRRHDASERHAFTGALFRDSPKPYPASKSPKSPGRAIPGSMLCAACELCERCELHLGRGGSDRLWNPHTALLRVYACPRSSGPLQRSQCSQRSQSPPCLRRYHTSRTVLPISGFLSQR